MRKTRAMSTFFSTFKYNVGDIVVARSNRAVAFVIVQWLLVECDTWTPLYRVTHVQPDGSVTRTLVEEVDIDLQ